VLVELQGLVLQDVLAREILRNDQNFTETCCAILRAGEADTIGGHALFLLCRLRSRTQVNAIISVRSPSSAFVSELVALRELALEEEGITQF
jgi:hypothetical protein